MKAVVANGQGVMLDPNPSDVQREWKRMPRIGSACVSVKGSFTAKTPEESDSGIPAEVLEPRILALVGAASAAFAAKRGNKRQA